MGKADRIMDIVLDELSSFGYTLEDIHLLDYETWDKISKSISLSLRINGLNLSYDSDYSEIYEIKLSGNYLGILADIKSFYTKRSKYGWVETKLSIKDIEFANEYYKKDKYGCAVKISKENFMKLISSGKNEFNHIGIGSQSSIIETNITLYKDAKNNIMYDKSILVYD